MTQEVLPLRFVNTPTVMEVYEAGHKAEALGLDEEDEEKLSDEYDKVDGNEAYYRILFEHLNKGRVEGTVAGNEGLFDWAKKAVQGVIDTIRAFFQWVWNLFGGKSKKVEQKTEQLEKQVKKVGVKSGDIEYPASYVQVWGAAGKPPAALAWMHEKIAKVEKGIDQCSRHSGLIAKYCDKIHSIYSPKIANFGLFKADVEKAIAEHGKTVGALFTSADASNWVGGTKVTVSKEGKVVIARMPGGIKAVKGAKFKTNLTEVEKILSEIASANSKFDDLVKKNAELEDKSIKLMENALNMLKVFATNNTGKAKEVMALMKKVTNNAMATIRAHDLLFTEVLLSATYLVNAALSTGGTKE